MPHVGGQNERPFHQAEQQRQHDDLGHVPEEIAQLTLDEEERRKGHHRGHNCRKHGGQHLQRAVDGRTRSVFAHLVMSIDVLGNDNPVIHEDANHEDHPKQADDVDRHPEHPRENEHARKRHWNGQRHPKRESDVQEQRQQNHHQQEADHPVVHEQVNPLVEHDRTVSDDVQVQAGADGFGLVVVAVDVAPHQGGDVQNALCREVVHRDDHGGRPIVPIPRGVVFRPPVANLCDVRQPNDAPVGKRPNDNVLNGLGIVTPESPPDNQFLAIGLQPAARGLDVRSANRRTDLGDRQIQFRQAVGPHRHFNLFTREPAQAHLTDSLQGAQVLFDAARFPFQGPQIVHPRHGKRDGHAFRLPLEHNRRLHPCRERSDAVHCVFDVLKDVVGLVGVFDRDRDVSGILTAHRFDLIQPRNALEVFFNFGHNALFNFRWRRPGIDDLNLNRLGLNDWKKVAFDGAQTHPAGHQQRDHQQVADEVVFDEIPNQPFHGSALREFHQHPLIGTGNWLCQHLHAFLQPPHKHDVGIAMQHLHRHECQQPVFHDKHFGSVAREQHLVQGHDALQGATFHVAA